ncbi:MAG: hypothetical protein H7247_12380 [Polaromonas sp.]|nr:hypothetical protein [Gemmatimonadaceae bacterium]
MHLLSLKHLVAATLLIVAPVATRMSYPRATVTNYEGFPAVVEVNYRSCKKDNFTVPAATRVDLAWVPGTATASTNRGVCLISSITASLTGDTAKVTTYTSSGTSYSQFVIRRLFCGRAGLRVWSKSEYSTHNSNACFGSRR